MPGFAELAISELGRFLATFGMKTNRLRMMGFPSPRSLAPAKPIQNPKFKIQNPLLVPISARRLSNPKSKI